MADALSFERMFCYRATGLAGYIALFYVLVYILGALGLPGWVALAILVGATAVTTFSICRWREGEGWLEAGGDTLTLLCGCGMVPAMLIDERRPVHIPNWSLLIFSLCASEAVFFLSALGVFGAVLANPLAAIGVGIIVFAIQTSILAVGFQFSAKRRG